MNTAKLMKVIECSSEDEKHPASNLVNRAGVWKCIPNGETNFVIIQFEKAGRIIGMDIVNEHSAYVEVFVGRSSDSPPVFKAILEKRLFTNAIDSRNCENINRVRCFAKSDLIESVANEEWDLIKFACSQPYARHVKYGLHQVSVYVQKQQDDEDSNRAFLPSPNKLLHVTQTIGKFQILEEPCMSTVQEESMFQRWKQKNKTKEMFSAAAEIRAMTPLINSGDPHIEKKLAGTYKQEEQKIKTKETFSGDPHIEKKLAGTYREEEQRNKTKETFSGDPHIEKKLAGAYKEEEQRNKTKETFSGDPHIEKKLAGTYREEEQKNKTKETFSGDPHIEKKLAGTSKEEEKPSTILQRKQPQRKVVKDKDVSFTSNVPIKRNPKHEYSPIVSTSSVAKKKLKIDKQINYKPFNKLLEGVVFVFSGFVNPERGDLRSKAIELGGKYKPDWNNSCTHLICAFKNTPKYNQVKGRGKIVSKDWINDCFSSKKRLSWRKYALEDGERGKSDSEDEIFDVSLKPREGTTTDADIPKPVRTTKRLFYSEDEVDSDDNVSVAGASFSKQNETSPNQEASKCDSPQDKIIFDESTDEENVTRTKPPPGGGSGDGDIFKNFKFFIATELENKEKSTLSKIIEKYSGKITHSLDTSDYIIAIRQNTKFVTSKSTPVVSPEWIYECQDMDCFVPITRYAIN